MVHIVQLFFVNFTFAVSLLLLSTVVTADESSSTGPCDVKLNTYYVLISEYEGTLASGQPPQHSNVVHSIRSDSDLEKWYFRKSARKGKNVYFIINKDTGLALTANVNSTTENSGVTLETFKGNQSQLFVITPASKVNNDCEITSVETETNLVFDEPPTGSNFKLVGNEPKGVWRLNEFLCDPHPNQTYRLVHRRSGFVASVPTASQNYGDRIKLVLGQELGDHARVVFKHVNGYKNLRHIMLWHSGKYFIVDGASKDRNGTLSQYGQEQSYQEYFRFHISQTADSWCTIKAFHSQRYLGAEPDAKGQYSFGTQLVQLDQTPTLDSHFRFKQIGFIPYPDMPYRIRNRYSDKFMDVNASSVVSGTAIVQNPYSNNTQIWFFTPYKYNSYRLKAGHSALVVETNNNADQSKPAVLNTKLETNSQSLVLTEGCDKDYVWIQSQGSGLDLAPLGRGRLDNWSITAVSPRCSDMAQEWAIEQDV